MLFLKQLGLVNFKNYTDCEIRFCQGINCLTGDNGMGKTNVLDAIYYLAFSKSFFNPIDSQNIRHNEPFFVIQGEFERNGEKEMLYCGMKRGEKKILKRNKKAYTRLSDHIGLFPLVIISPEDTDLLHGGSEERRKFIDGVISQFNPGYLEILINYTKVLAQRNALLKQLAEGSSNAWDTLSVWNDRMAEFGIQIFQTRETFMGAFNEYFQKYYENVSGGRETVGLRYDSQLHDASFHDLLKQSERKDIERQHSTVGIHKDDVTFLMQETPVKKFGSQGQQKSYLVALKLAQYDFLKKKKGFDPMILLDDIFDKLDAHRVKAIVKLLSGDEFGQVFITDTDANRITQIMQSISKESKIYRVENGVVITI